MAETSGGSVSRRSSVVHFPLGRVKRSITRASNLPFVLILFATLVEFRNFFGSGSIMIGDFVPPSVYYVQTGESTSLNTVHLGGVFNLNVGYYPISASLSYLSEFTGPEIAYRIFFIGIVVLSGVGLILLIRDVLPHVGLLSQSLAGLIYANNPFIDSDGVLAGHLGALGFAYALLPLVVLLILRFNRTYWFGYGALATGLVALAMAAEIYLVIFLLPLLLLLPLSAVTTFRRGWIAEYARLFASTACVYALAVMVAAYWILPYAALDTSQVNFQLNTITLSSINGVSQYGSLLFSSRFLDYSSYPFSFGIYSTSNIGFNAVYQVSSYVYLVLALFPALILTRTRWPGMGWPSYLYGQYFCYILLAGGSQILGSTYLGLAQSFPFFNDPAQFMAFVALSVSLLAAVSLQFVIDRARAGTPNPAVQGPQPPSTTRPPRILAQYARLRRSRRPYRIALAFTVAAVLLCVWPSWTGTFNGAYNTVVEPAAYSQVYSWIESHSDRGRSLWLPSTGAYPAFSWVDRYGYDQVSDPVRWQTLTPVLNSPFDGVAAQSTDQFILQIQDMLYFGRTSTIGQLLSAANVQYLVIRTDVTPASFGWILLNSSENQSDLSLAYSDPPLFVFANEVSGNYITATPRPFVVFGGFTTLNALPSLGLDAGDSTAIPAELAPPQVSSALLENNQSVPFVPITNYLDFVRALIPSQYALSLASLVSPDWVYDPYAGAKTGDTLAQGALDSESGTALSISFETQAPGETSILLNSLGGTQLYNFTIDGTLVRPTNSSAPQSTFVWSVFNQNLPPGRHTFDVIPVSPGAGAVGGIVVCPRSVLNATVSEGLSLLKEDSGIIAVPAPSLGPSGDANWTNIFSLGESAPYRWGITLGLSGLGEAGTGETVPLVSGNYSVGLLAQATDQGPASTSLVLRQNESGTWTPSVFALPPPSSSLAWTQVNISLPLGVYGVQLTGANTLISDLTFLPRDAPVQGPMGALKFASVPSPIVNVSASSSTEWAGNVSSTGLTVLDLSFTSSEPWTFASGKGGELIGPDFGFGLAALVDLGIGQHVDYTFSFPIQSDHEIGIGVTLTTGAGLIAVTIIQFALRRHRYYPRGIGASRPEL